MKTVHEIIRYGNVDRLRTALRTDPDLANARDPEGGTPLGYAFEHDASDDVILALLEFGADPRESKGTKPVVGDRVEMSYVPPIPIMHRAVGRGDVALVEAVVAHGGRLRDDGSGPLMHSAVQGKGDRLPMVEYLLSHGLLGDVPDEYGWTPLMYVSRDGRFDVVERLLLAGADDQTLGWSLSHWFAVFGGSDVTKGLDDLDHAGRTPLHLALRRGDLAAAQRLVALGASLDVGFPLVHAAEGGNADAVSWLLALGVTLGLDQALEHAIEEDRVEVARRLLAAGAETGYRDYLWDAATSSAMIRVLLDAGADPTNLGTDERRLLLGWKDRAGDLSGVSPADYRRDRYWRPGKRNPEHLASPYCEAMFRAGWDAYEARRYFDDEEISSEQRGRDIV